MSSMYPATARPDSGRRALTVLALTLALVATPLAMPAYAQSHDSPLFEEADRLMAEAKDVHADVLAPESFDEATRYYRRAEISYERGKSDQDIIKDLADAIENLRHAIETADLIQTELDGMLAARADALSAGAPEHAKELWTQGNRAAEDAAEAAEERKPGRAREHGDEAIGFYRDAELASIKAGFFDETEALLLQAEDERIDRYATVTLARSRALLAEAAAALEADRYDTDLPRTLAHDALYEARHAFRIAETALRVDRRESTVEAIMLEAEAPLTEIAGVFDIVPRFDDGYAQVTAEVVDQFETLTSEHSILEQALVDCRNHRDELELRLGELEEELGGVSEERQAMERRLLAEEKVRERFVQVEGVFTRDEARVLREGERIMIRLVGVQFDSGSDVIEPQYFGLLTRVQDAIALFPESVVSIEGHTDSYGTDGQNLALSMSRAEAVQQYLVANMRLDGERIEAVGLGESEPIANNETREGRARNRRIDVIITPNLDAVMP